MTTWNNNLVQFPRILAEIVATQNLDIPALAESMDLSVEEVNELLDRAQNTWESIKGGEEVSVPVLLNVFDEEGVMRGEQTIDMSLLAINDVVSQAGSLINAYRSDREDETFTEELESALESYGVIDWK